MQRKPPSDDQLNDWIPAQDIVDLARIGNETDPAVRKWLWDRLRGGITDAYARSSFDSVGKGPFGVTLVPRQAWQQMNHNADEFWSSGTLSYEYCPDGAGAYGLTIETTFLDVRFDPDTIRSAPMPAANIVQNPAPEEDRCNLLDLSESLLQEWAALFSKAYPSGSESLAASSVAGMFPDKKVTRARLRRITPKNSVGKPKNNKD